MTHHDNLRPGQVGYKFSEKSKAKMRAAKLGKKQNPEAVARRADQMRGRKRSPEAVEKGRQTRLANGKKRTPDMLERQSASLRKHFADTANRQANKDRQRARWIGHKRKRGSYIHVWIPEDHPMAEMRRNKGYVAEHRLVMAMSLGRPLSVKELVHHIDHDKTNNRIENLQLMSRSEHMSLHNAIRFEGRRRKPGGRYDMKWVPKGHPARAMCGKQFYIMKHRFVMADHLGRPLERHEHVHHINGDRRDNRLENLELVDRSAHVKFHAGKPRSGVIHAGPSR